MVEPFRGAATGGRFAGNFFSLLSVDGSGRDESLRGSAAMGNPTKGAAKKIGCVGLKLVSGPGRMSSPPERNRPGNFAGFCGLGCRKSSQKQLTNRVQSDIIQGCLRMAGELFENRS